MAGIFFPSHSEDILTAKPNQQNFFWKIDLICMVVEFQIHGTFEIKVFRKIRVRDRHQNLADAAHKYTKIVFFSAIAENEFSKFASKKSLVVVENIII